MGKIEEATTDIATEQVEQMTTEDTIIVEVSITMSEASKTKTTKTPDTKEAATITKGIQILREEADSVMLRALCLTPFQK